MSYIRSLYRREPARVVAVVVSGVLAVATALGFVVEEQNVGAIVAVVLTVLLGGEATRSKVRPEG